MKIQVSANKLAEFIDLKSPERRKRLVRQLKLAPPGHPVFYPLFRGPAQHFLVDGGRNASELLALIEKLKVRVQSKWYQTDSRITAEAIRALIKLSPELRKIGGTFYPRVGGAKIKLQFGEVYVGATPNLIVHGERNGKPLVGALRFYLAKESVYQLGPRRAELIAVMEHEWLKRVATGARVPDSALCIVAECFQQRITSAPEDTAADLAIIERGCTEFAALWHLIDDKEAA